MSIYKEYNKINVLFLDIDECLNNNLNEETDAEHKRIVVYGQEHWDSFNPRLIENINMLIERYNFKIVLSSTWRLLFDIYTMNDLFKNHMGIKGEIIDYTTKRRLDVDYKERLEWEGVDVCIPRERGLQITEWLNEGKYNVNQYLIIDDGIDVIYGHENNYHRPNGKYGFDYVSYLMCIEKFDKKFGVYKS